MATTKAATKWATGATEQVTAWACGMCNSVHATKRDADECCRCSQCRGKFEKTSPHGSVCGGCSWGQDVRRVRADIRRVEEQLASSKQRLAELLAAKPPKAMAVELLHEDPGAAPANPRTT